MGKQPGVSLTAEMVQWLEQQPGVSF